MGFEKKIKVLLQRCLDIHIKNTERIYNCLKKSELLNEQWVLDWLDKLNEISVR